MFDKLGQEFLSNYKSERGGNWETESGYILAIKEYSFWLDQRCDLGQIESYKDFECTVSDGLE